MLSSYILLALLNFGLLSSAEPMNEEAKIPSLYWGVEKQERFPQNTSLVNRQEEFITYSFSKKEVPIPFPLKAYYAKDNSGRYWSQGNNIYYYNPQLKKTQLIHSQYVVNGNWKLWRIRNVNPSPTGKYLSFIEVYADLKQGHSPRFESKLVILNLATKKSLRFSSFFKSASWSPKRDRFGYIQACEPSEGSYKPCGGINLIDGDGTHATKILNSHTIESFEWLDSDSIMFWENNTYYSDDEYEEKRNAISIMSSDGLTQQIIDLKNDFKEYSDVSAIQLSANRKSILFWARKFVTPAESGTLDGGYSHSLYVSDLHGEVSPVVRNLFTDSFAYPYAEFSPNGSKVVVQSCPEFSDYCNLTKVHNLQSGKYVNIKGKVTTFWLDDNNLLYVMNKNMQGSASEAVGEITRLTFGQSSEVQYYIVDIGDSKGLKRGDVFSVYEKAEFNPITGEESGINRSSIKGNLIVVKVEQDKAWTIKYTPNDVELKNGYLVSNDLLTGKIVSQVKSGQKY